MNFLNINLKPILFFSCYACVLIFSTIGDFNLFDWDEINFAESSREMLLSNNFSQVMINFEPFHEKPPLFFWIQTISFKISLKVKFSPIKSSSSFGFKDSLFKISLHLST